MLCYNKLNQGPYKISNCRFPATDNSGVVRVTHTHGPSPGEELPVGEYEVTYTATDSENNIAHCVFKVIIKRRCFSVSYVFF